jgi:hypothetical protein
VLPKQTTCCDRLPLSNHFTSSWNSVNGHCEILVPQIVL